MSRQPLTDKDGTVRYDYWLSSFGRFVAAGETQVGQSLKTKREARIVAEWLSGGGIKDILSILESDWQPGRFFYECQERAMAPGIADGWPNIIPAPHTPNGRLVRRKLEESHGD